MKYLMVKCEKSDVEFIEEVKRRYPDAEIIEEHSFGGEEWITIVFSTLGLTVEFANLLLAYLSYKKNNSDNEPPKSIKKKKRAIIYRKSEKPIADFSPDELIEFLVTEGFVKNEDNNADNL